MLNKKSITHLFLILAILFLILWSVSNLSSLSSILGLLLSALTPILAGLCIAFVLNLLLRPLERLWNRIFRLRFRRARRPVCLILCLLLVFSLIYLILIAVIPPLIQTLGTLIQRIPDYVAQITLWWGKLSELLSKFSVTLPPLDVNAPKIAEAVQAYLEEHGPHLLNVSLGVAATAFSVAFDTVLSIVLAIYFLAYKRRLRGQVKKLMSAFLSDETAQKLLRLAHLARRTFSKFLTGQLTEALIIGGLCFVGMMIFGMPYPLLISVLVGVTALIPVFGAFIGTGVGAFLILMDSPILAFWFVLFILILQQVEGNLIYPRVVGKSVGLPGVWVLIAVTIGSSFGVVGMLLSVPTFSVIYTLLRQYAESHRP